MFLKKFTYSHKIFVIKGREGSRRSNSFKKLHIACDMSQYSNNVQCRIRVG